MFRGVHAINLDAKGRMAIPARYRQGLQDQCRGQLIITVDRESCLLIYPLPEWETIEEKLTRLPTLDKKARALQRMLIGHASECELDSHGRILVPTMLREYASIDKRVILLGQGNKFELWDEQIWGERRSQWLRDESEGEEPLSSQLGSLSF